MRPRVLIIIPARGGSKGIPRKNLSLLNGKTLLEHVSRTATSIKGVSRVICSTEDKEIARMAEDFGVEVPFLRPSDLASDVASTADVVIHALDTMSSLGETFDYIILLEPTSPLTRAVDVELAFSELISKSTIFDSLITLCRSESGHPVFTFRLDSETQKVDAYLPGSWKVIRRQELEPLYYIDGSFYISKVNTFYSTKTFVQERTMGFTVPKWQSFEVDEPVDLTIVEAIMKAGFGS